MDLSDRRASALEMQRTEDLVKLMPHSGESALDIGARDGFFSLILAERFATVSALDLELPEVAHPRVTCVKGNATSLPFPDKSMDFVFCAEVLEHIPPDILARACGEMERVCSGRILIGVPYRQDIRLGRSTCRRCQGRNPPWGHVNSFDEQGLARLFPRCSVERISYVGECREQTNALSALLMDIAGNPYGTYSQIEPCIHCGEMMGSPGELTIPRKVAAKLAVLFKNFSDRFAQPRANWIHLILAPAAT